jgi:hypothetical protein
VSDAARAGRGKPAADERPISLLDLADAISDRELQSRVGQQQPEPLPFTPGIGPTVSTEGASFASILAGLTETVAEPTRQDPVREPSPREPSSEKAVEVRPTFAPPMPGRITVRAAHDEPRNGPRESRARSRAPRRPRSRFATCATWGCRERCFPPAKEATCCRCW